MTVSSTAAASGPFIGTGATQTLPFEFHAASADEIRVEVDDIDFEPFTVTLESDGTGSVTGVFPLGGTIYIESAPSFQQEAQFDRFAPVFPDAFNPPLDRAAIRDIALKDKIDRAPLAPRDGSGNGRFASLDADGRWVYVSGVGGGDDALRVDLATGTGSIVGTLAQGIGAVARSQRDRNSDRVSVMDYMSAADRAAVRTGTAFPDVTYAFTAAIAASRHVDVPPGGYGLIGWRALNGATLNGANDETCVIKQLDPTVPALNILSDASVGQLKGLSITGLKVIGADEFASPVVYAAAVADGLTNPAPAVFVGASGAYAIWDSEFSFFAKNTYRAIETLGTDAGNVYQCTFNVTSEGTRGEAAYLRGGGYSDFFLFLTQCDTWGVDASCGNSRIRAITENSQRYSGQMNDIWGIVEAIVVAAPPIGSENCAFYDNGFNNVYHTPTINLPDYDVGKVSFGFRPFSGTVYINPQLIGPVRPIFPFADCFYSFTILNARGTASGFMEGYYDDSTPNRTMSKVTLLGDVKDFTNYRPYTREVVYLPAAGAVAAGIQATTGYVILQGTVDPIPSLDVAFAITPYEGLTLEFSSDKAVTAVTWPADAAYADLPASLAANTPLRIVYSATAGKFLRIGA